MRGTVTPAYGREYKSKKAAIADWVAGKDFLDESFDAPWPPRPTSERDWDEVNIRYARKTRVVWLKKHPDSGWKEVK